jgi:deazaflavin-dependent oxidoreductase (nitroreductase family)
MEKHVAGNDLDLFMKKVPAKKNELEGLPDEVMRELNAHRDLYVKDPEAAHIWDPIVIGVEGGPVRNLLLTYTGRKSGRKLQTVLQYYTYFGKYAIVASRGGTVDHPFWYKNLVENPECKIQVASFASTATARTLEGDERANWWPLITKEQPEQIKYQTRTTRIIPVVVLDLPK